jgi:hypothetical protein
MGLRTQRAGVWIAQHYPADWRRRYGADLEDYLEQRQARFIDLAGLIGGLVDAQVQVLSWRDWWPTMNRHLTRGLLLSGVAAVLLLVESGGLVKASEDGPVAALTHHDAVAALGLGTVVVSACLALLVVAVGSGQSLWLVARRLVAKSDVRGLAALLSPVALGAVLFAELLVVAGHVDGHQPLSVVVLALSGVLAAGASLWCLSYAVRRAEVEALPTRTARPAAAMLAFLATLGLAGEAVWASRVASLPSWAQSIGFVSLSMPITLFVTAAFGVGALLLALTSRHELAHGPSADA